MAVATVDGLAKAAVHIGRTIHRGDAELALDDFDELVGRLHRFMNYVVLAEVLLDGRDPDVGQAMGQFKSRIFASLDGVETALEARDMGRVGVDLARGLATALLEYRGISGRIEGALAAADQVMAA